MRQYLLPPGDPLSHFGLGFWLGIGALGDECLGQLEGRIAHADALCSVRFGVVREHTC
jgi:hypothetical protein